jgi:hypothetical protein
MKVTLIKSIFSNEILPRNRKTYTWENFCKLLSQPQVVADKGDALLISPVEYVDKEEAAEFTESGNVRRCSDNVRAWHAIPVDIDGQMTIADAQARFADYEYVLYTTFSHQSADKPYDCFRIFFRLANPVSNDDFMSRKAALREFIGSHDQSTLATSRAFYVPSCSEAGLASAVYYHNVGISINLMDYEPEIVEIYTPDSSREPPSLEFKASVLQALHGLREIEYSDWWKIGSAMQDSGYAEHEFEELSHVIRSHRKNNCRMQWRCSRRKKIGFGYLVNLVIEHFGKDALKTTSTAPRQSSSPLLRDMVNRARSHTSKLPPTF